MKLGPLHLIKDKTFRHLDHKVRDLRAKLEQHFPVLSYQHPPVNVRVAAAVLTEPDPATAEVRAATARVVAAYQQARRDMVQPAPGVWDAIEDRHRPFVDALDRGEQGTVLDYLRRLFHTDLLWGLGRVHWSLVDDLRANPQSEYQKRITDSLVSLAEAVAAARLTSAEQQGVESHLDALDVDLDDILRRIEERTGLDPSFPAIAGAYGVRIAGKLVTMDSLTHAYTLYRSRQLGAGPDAVIAEIGGGYGCLAWLFHQAGQRRYAIYDLPWVNALQGYFLIRALPAGAVRLHGETEGKIEVLPHWCFHQLPDRSVDLVINTNSMPEMSAGTARAYLAGIRRVARGVFLSVNQEARTPMPGGTQCCVAELVRELGSFRVLSRSRWWMFPGYAEEVFVPIRGRESENPESP